MMRLQTFVLIALAAATSLESARAEEIADGGLDATLDATPDSTLTSTPTSTRTSTIEPVVLRSSIAGPPPQARAALSGVELADRVLVVKSERKLYLLKNDRTLRAFDVSLGFAPSGHKLRSGDSRTPEGRYYLDARNVDSDFFLSIHVSYPNEDDRRRAAALGVDPGGQIMIHGLPNELKYDERRYAGTDWTDGCIALANADMIDVWLMTSEMTPIEIRP